MQLKCSFKAQLWIYRVEPLFKLPEPPFSYWMSFWSHPLTSFRWNIINEEACLISAAEPSSKAQHLCQKCYVFESQCVKFLLHPPQCSFFLFLFYLQKYRGDGSTEMTPGCTCTGSMNNPLTTCYLHHNQDFTIPAWKVYLKHTKLAILTEYFWIIPFGYCGGFHWTSIESFKTLTTFKSNGALGPKINIVQNRRKNSFLLFLIVCLCVCLLVCLFVFV